MRNMLRIFVAASFILAWAGFAQSGGDDGRAIVDKAIKAVGGADKLAKHQAVTFTEKGTYYGMGDGLPFTGKYALQYPGQFRMEIENVFTIVLNGDKGWVSANGEVKEMTKEQLDVQRHDNKAGWIMSLAPLTDKAFTIKKLPDAKVDGKEAHVVQVSRKDYPDVKLYFDAKSNLLMKGEYKTKAADMKFMEVAVENKLSDYREVDGVLTPHKMVMNRDGKVFVESEVTSLKADGKLDAKVFAQPE
jgi:outer membrane lipoprotein-sorting protein